MLFQPVRMFFIRAALIWMVLLTGCSPQPETPVLVSPTPMPTLEPEPVDLLAGYAEITGQANYLSLEVNCRSSPAQAELFTNHADFQSEVLDSAQAMLTLLSPELVETENLTALQCAMTYKGPRLYLSSADGAIFVWNNQAQRIIPAKWNGQTLAEQVLSSKDAIDDNSTYPAGVPNIVDDTGQRIFDFGNSEPPESLYPWAWEEYRLIWNALTAQGTSPDELQRYNFVLALKGSLSNFRWGAAVIAKDGRSAYIIWDLDNDRPLLRVDGWWERDKVRFEFRKLDLNKLGIAGRLQLAFEGDYPQLVVVADDQEGRVAAVWNAKENKFIGGQSAKELPDVALNEGQEFVFALNPDDWLVVEKWGKRLLGEDQNGNLWEWDGTAKEWKTFQGKYEVYATASDAAFAKEHPEMMEPVKLDEVKRIYAFGTDELLSFGELESGNTKFAEFSGIIVGADPRARVWWVQVPFDGDKPERGGALVAIGFDFAVCLLGFEGKNGIAYAAPTPQQRNAFFDEIYNKGERYWNGQQIYFAIRTVGSAGQSGAKPAELDGRARAFVSGLKERDLSGFVFNLKPGERLFEVWQVNIRK